jgi:prepilin-type N-terminal cleavage/methylation domain-containing protein
MTASTAPRHGFTLVELMVAMVISTFVVTAVYSAITFASDAHNRRAETAAPLLSDHAARAALQSWLRAADLGVAPFIGSDRRDGDIELDELTFGLTDGGALHPGPARLRLRTDPHGAGVTAEILTIGGGPGHSRTMVLGPGAHGLSLRYRTLVAARHVWLDEWQSGAELPYAVEIRFIFAHPPATSRAALRHLPLVLPAGWEGK